MNIFHSIRRVASTVAPTVGVDIATDRVSAVALGRQPTKPKLLGHATELLPAGAIVPSASEHNIVDRVSVVEALNLVLEQLPRRATRVVLTIPDSIAKVSFVQFESVPDRTSDLDQVIGWKVHKTVPFRLEDSQLAYSPGAPQGEEGREYIVTLVRRDIVQEYESLCDEAGVHAGLVDLVGMNLVNVAIMMTPRLTKDWLLVHSSETASTLAIIRNQDLIFFRSRPTTTEGDFADLVHQSAMYYQDRLNGDGLKRAVFVDGRGSATGTLFDAIGETLEYRLAMPINRLALDDEIDTLGLNLDALDSIAAPIGLLLRQRPNAG